jgi:hypothetical protein
MIAYTECKITYIWRCRYCGRHRSKNFLIYPNEDIPKVFGVPEGWEGRITNNSLSLLCEECVIEELKDTP